ncbi:hypothetical protein [Erwinia sp. MYb535]
MRHYDTVEQLHRCVADLEQELEALKQQILSMRGGSTSSWCSVFRSR